VKVGLNAVQQTEKIGIMNQGMAEGSFIKVHLFKAGVGGPDRNFTTPPTIETYF
jgi:hypothetical protein